jgi:predicted phage tail protein
MNTSEPKKKSKTINARWVTNPFEPLMNIRTETWKWYRGRTLIDYLPIGMSDEYVVSKNGRIIVSEEFSKTYLDPDDFVVLCPVVRGGGGGGGKMILRAIAMVVIAVASVYTGGAAASAYTGLAAGSAAAAASTTFAVVSAVTAAAVMVAGSLLVNALLPMPTASASLNTGMTSSSSYGADGAKNTSTEGLPVPVNYGEFQLAGNVIGLYTDVNGSDANSQILYMLINAGEGPIASIGNIKINDQPIADYAEVEHQERLGYPTQGVIDWFSQNITPISESLHITGSDYVTLTTSDVVDQFRLDFNCPTGLFSVDKTTGNLTQNTIVLLIDYRMVGGDGAWTPLKAVQRLYHYVTVTPVLSHDVPSVRDSYGYSNGDLGQENVATITGIVVTDAVNPQNPIAQYAVDQIMSKYGYLIGKPSISWPSQAMRSRDDVFSDVDVLPFQDSVFEDAPSSALTILDNSRSAVRRTYLSPKLTNGRYEIRVRKDPNGSAQLLDSSGHTITNLVADVTDSAASDIYLTDLNEITVGGVAYNNTALLALKVKLDDQLSGVPNVTFRHGGKMVRVLYRSGAKTVQTMEPSRNPAWIWFDMATNTRYGAGINESRIDLQSVLTWADYCTANDLTWNGPIDSTMNFWDASQLVLRVGHAQTVNVGTKFFIALEAPADPVMMFGMGNIVQDTFKQTWIGKADRATEIDVTFYDKDDNYKQKTVKVADASVASDGTMQNVSAITLYGVDEITKAFKEGAFALNLNKYIQQTVEFQAPLEALGCTVGDVVLVQHDMPAWAASGRLAAGCTSSTIKLDKIVTMEVGTQYKLLTLQDFVERARVTVASITGNYVAFAEGMPTASRVMRLISDNGTDVAITGVSDAGVFVDRTDGIAQGWGARLIDTDVVEEADVVTQPGETDTITLATPLTYTPSQLANYMFGDITRVKKPYRVKAITLGSSDLTRLVTAIEYRPEVYDLTSYNGVLGTLAPPMLDPKQAAISVVRDLTVYEETYVSGSQIRSDVAVNWYAPMIGSYAGADVYLQVNSGPNQKVATVQSASRYTLNANKGDVLTVRVVAFDIWGKYTSYDQSPVATYTVVGQIGSIEVGQVSGADYYWSGRDCKITWRYNATTAAFEFGSEPNGADQGTLDPQFMDYEIRVYDKDKQHLLRTEHTTDNSYVYSYDKNVADGLHRYLHFEIAMRDKFGNVGKWATLDAYNPPPQVVAAGVNASYDRATVAYQHSDDPDFAGAIIWMDQDPNVPMTDGYKVFDGPDMSILLSNLMFNADYYLRIAAYDAFGEDELLPSAEIHFRTTYMDVNAIAAGVLSDSLLVPALQARLNLIDGPDSIVGSVNARLSSVQTDILDQVGTDITTTQNIAQSATSAVSSRVDTVSAKVDTNAAAIQTETTARVNADGSLSTQISTVAANTASNLAAIQTETSARTSADSALSSRIDTVSASASNALAAVTTETNARASADSSLSSQITTVVSQANSNTAAIQTQQTVTNGLSAQYTVKIDNNGTVSGFGLASYPVNSGIVSEFIVNANKFSVIIPGAPKSYPFTIGTVNGVVQTIMSSAIIGDAAINTAKIGDAQVNTFKIGGNAVTVPASTTRGDAVGGNNISRSGGSYSGSLNYGGGLTFSVTDANAVTQILIFATQGNGALDTNSTVWAAELRLNGVTQNGVSGYYWQDTFTLAWGGTLGPGTYTAELYWGAAGASSSLNARSIMSIGCKR